MEYPTHSDWADWGMGKGRGRGPKQEAVGLDKRMGTRQEREKEGEQS